MISISISKHGLIALLVVTCFFNIAKSKCKDWPADYPVKLVSVELDSVYDQLFQANESGWLGADAATSIVLDDYPDSVILELYCDLSFCCLSMLPNISKCLLGDTEEHQLYLFA